MEKIVNIGGHDYEIKIIEMCPGDNFMGQVDYHHKKITVKKSIPDTGKKQTIAHEMMHALLYESGTEAFLSANNINAEAVPELIENIFYRFLDENTDLFTNIGFEKDQKNA